MIKKTVSFLLISAVFFGIASTVPLLAQTTQTKQEQKIENLKSEIKKRSLDRDTIKVKLYSGTTYKGSVSQANDVNFVIIDKTGASHSVNYADVNSIGGKGLSTGAKIGIGAAIGAGAVLAVLGIIIASDN